MINNIFSILVLCFDTYPKNVCILFSIRILIIIISYLYRGALKSNCIIFHIIIRREINFFCFIFYEI
jgi:hypothetical protein